MIIKKTIILMLRGREVSFRKKPPDNAFNTVGGCDVKSSSIPQRDFQADCKLPENSERNLSEID